MPAPGVVRCAIYTRRSIRRDETQSSCGAQWFACWQHISARHDLGWRAITEEWFEDDGESGGSLDRPALVRLLEAVVERRVDRVLVHRLDRLTRSVHDWAQIAGLFEAHDVGLTVVRDGLDLDGGAISRLQLAAFAARRARGLRSGGRVAFGYVADPRTKQRIVAPAEAEVVRALFASIEGGATPAALADDLNSRRVADKAGKIGAWNPRAILRVVGNPIHVGGLRDGSTGAHEAIVDRAIFDRVATKIAARRTRAPTARSGYVDADPYVLRGLLECAACGRRMTTSSRGKLAKVSFSAQSSPRRGRAG